jgi:hypothetical protein
MSRSGLFSFQNEPIWLIHDSKRFPFFNRFGRKVLAIRDTQFGIGRTLPAIRDTRVRLVLLVYCQARATPNDHFVQMPPRLSLTAWACNKRLKQFGCLKQRYIHHISSHVLVGEGNPDLSLIFQFTSTERRQLFTLLRLVNAIPLPYI